MNKLYLALLFIIISSLEGKTQNLEGLYNCAYSKQMGNWLISENSELEIKRDKNKILKYTVKRTITDEYNNNVPSTTTFSGIIKRTTLKSSGVEAWLFVGGDYGKHGAYFVTTESKVKSIRVWIPAIGYGKEQSRDYIKN